MKETGKFIYLGCSSAWEHSGTSGQASSQELDGIAGWEPGNSDFYIKEGYT